MIAEEVLRVAQMPAIGTNDVGYVPTIFMARLGVRPDDGIPLIVERLRTAMSLTNKNDFYNETTMGYRSLQPWGTNASAAVLFLEDELLPAWQRELRSANSLSQQSIANHVKMVKKLIEELSP
jgi:hypothetical protein